MIVNVADTQVAVDANPNVTIATALPTDGADVAGVEKAHHIHMPVGSSQDKSRNAATRSGPGRGNVRLGSGCRQDLGTPAPAGMRMRRECWQFKVQVSRMYGCTLR